MRATPLVQVAGAVMLCLSAMPASANLLTNGGFEQLAGDFPTDWSAFAPDFGPETQTEIGPSSDARSGQWSLRLAVAGKAHPGEMAGVNRAYPRDVQPAGRLEVRRGGFTFWYKHVRAGGGRAAVQVIAMGKSDVEDTGSLRVTFDLPAEHAGDGRWHEGWLKFDFTDNDKVAWVQPVLRIFEGPAEFLVDDIAYVERLGPRLTIAELVIEEDERQPGERGTLRVGLENTGDEAATHIAVEVTTPEGLSSQQLWGFVTMQPDETGVVGFAIAGRRDRPAQVTATVTCKGRAPVSRTLKIAATLEIESFHASPFIMEEHGESRLILRLRNSGNAIASDLKIQLRTPEALSAAGDDKPPPGDIRPGETLTRRWRLTGRQQSPVLRLHARVTADHGLQTHKATCVLVGGDLPGPGEDSPTAAEPRRRPEVIGLSREPLRIVFPYNAFGKGRLEYGIGAIQVRRGVDWHTVGMMPSLGRLVYLTSDGPRVERPIYGEPFGAWGGGPMEMRHMSWQFHSDFVDGDGAEWTVDTLFHTRGGAGFPRIGVDSRATCSKPRKVLAFEGPMIYWGEGAFGADKTDAIFPGLEWLAGDEQSSSTLDITTPGHLRYVVHPNRVTFPCITLSHDGLAVGMEWDPHQKWDGLHDRPSVVFASPNTFEDTNSHLMGLFVPSVPDYVEENKREASTPYLLEPGKTIRLRYTIFAGEGDALDGQVARYRVAEPLSMPRGDAQREIAFSMDSYSDSLWLPDEQVWWTSKGGGPLLSHKGAPAHFVDDLWLASIAVRDPALKRKYRDFAQRMLDRLSLSGAGYPLAFGVGGLDQAMAGLAGQVQNLIAAQWDDGSWRFDADRKDTAGVFKGYDYHELGPDNAAEVGTCAWNAYHLLRFARMTGDEKARDAGLKALEFMDQFKVPRAAQVWEVPVHTPDLLAASDAVEAYLEAYQITGEERYLDKAVYWGKAGLPFIYVWNAPGLKFMRYASIPVFGASQLKYSWLGRPVQWNGLRYGYALQKLARHDRSVDWARLAHGLMVSAMYQQADGGENKALWPDSIGAIEADKSAWVFAPYQITRILYTEMGLDPEPHTTILGSGARRIHLSAVARIVSASADVGRIEAALEYAAGESSRVLVCGVSEPSRVAVNDEALPRADSLDRAAGPAWWYDRARAMLIVRVAHAGTDRLTVEGVEAVESRFLPEIAQAIAFEFDTGGDTEGWYAAHDIAGMTAADGALAMSVTGGDPYLIRAAMRVEAGSVKQVVIGMKTTAGDQAQLFWATDGSPGIDEAKSLHFDIVSDGEFHEYRVPVGGHALWRGTITQLRLDPNQSQAGSRVEVDFVRGSGG